MTFIHKCKILKTPFGNLAYEKHGEGSEVYFLFHGFGQNRKAFYDFLKNKKENETYYFIDIFYHGESSWKSSDQKLSKEMWGKIILQMLEVEKIEDFHLVGYSLGGKFSLITFEIFPKKVKSMLLLAPDGIKTGFWYNMATFPGILKGVFRQVVFHPDRFFQTMKFLKKIGLLEKSLIKFVKSQMKTRTMRAQVFFIWIVFKPLKPDLSKIIQRIREQKTPIILVTGEYDKMVTSQNLERFSSKIPHLKSIELPCGHNALIEEMSSYLQLHKLN